MLGSSENALSMKEHEDNTSIRTSTSNISSNRRTTKQLTVLLESLRNLLCDIGLSLHGHCVSIIAPHTILSIEKCT